MTRRKLATDNTHRHCSRCNDALTDPISREVGVGPICRKKDSHLMAKNLPANYSAALIFAMSITDDMLISETIDVWHKAYKSLLKCSERAANSCDDMTVMARAGNDLREVIRACDFLCSFDHPGSVKSGNYVEVKSAMVQVIRALGYVGLAGVISGQASTSASKIWFENGRVYMTGLGNTSGWQTMKKIAGITTPKFRGDRSPYSAPVASMTAFLDAVQVHWPMYEGDVATITAEASAWKLAQPAPVAPVYTASFTVRADGTLVQPKPNTSGAVITLRSEDAVLRFNWVKGVNMFGFMAALKGVCAPKERSYNPATKEWSFLLAHLPRLIEVIEEQEIFGTPRVVTPEKDLDRARELTPPGLYGASKSGPRGAAQPWAGRTKANYLRFR